MLCIFHASCADGFTAAWIVHQRFPGTTFHAAHYGSEPPWEQIDGADVVIVDFSYKRPVMLQIIERCSSLVVLDHHKTALGELEGLGGEAVTIRFDLEKSGAALTWEFLNPETEPPDLIRYVQDRDLWTWALPFSKEVSAYLQTQPLDFAIWTWLSEVDIYEMAEAGKVVLDYQATVIASHVKHAVLMHWEGMDLPVVNATTLISEIGHALASQYPSKVAVMFFDDLKAGRRCYSLRSVEGGPDVAALASRYGGGGHPAAAGFAANLEDLMERYFPES